MPDEIEQRGGLSEPPVEESPEQSIEETEKHISSNVCDVCLNDNLLQKVGIAYCPRCRFPYCMHYASKVDGQYCVDCMSEISMLKEVITKTYEHEHYDEEKDDVIVTKYSRRARRIEITGLDWLFAQRKIKDLTDAELDMSIEYHRALQSAMLLEAEERRNAKAHRYAGVKVVIPTQSTTTTQATSKKTTVTSSTKQTAKLSALMQSLMQQGFTAEQLSSMLGGKK
jgi:hypothetical protein